MRLAWPIALVAFVAAVICLAGVPVRAGDGNLFVRVDSSQEKQSVSKGMQAAELLLKLIRSNEFAKVLDFIGTAGGPIAGTVTGILKLVIGSGSGGGTDSEDLKFAKQAFTEINSKLEAFTNEFREIKELIDWSAIQVSYGTYERSIRALKTQLQLIIEAPQAAIPDLRQLFVMKFESDFQNAAEKIYDGIVNADLIFSRNLLEASAKYTSNHRKQVQMFGMGLTQLLLQAVEIQMAYFDLKYANQDTTEYIKTVWNNRFAALKAKMRSFDDALAARWVSQVPLDAEKVIQDNKAMKNNELALKLHSVLAEKFFWRSFGVVVYNDVAGSDKHDFVYCQGYRKLAFNGKNIVLASVDKELQFEKARADNLAKALKPVEKNAGHILALLNKADEDTAGTCKNVQLKLVAVDSSGTEVASLASRSTVERVCVSSFWGTTCYNVVLFG